VSQRVKRPPCTSIRVNVRSKKIAAPRRRGATIAEPTGNSAARAALADRLLVSVVLAALMLTTLARLLRLLSGLLLSAALLLLAGLVLATAALLLAALAGAWSVLLLLVGISLVWIIH
jgi:hypothetical protein